MRILFLTLYYPPLNTIATHRVKAFVDHFLEQGIHCDVITRYYDEGQRSGNSMFIGSQSPRGMESSYYIENNIIYTNFNEDNNVIRFSKKMPTGIRGLYNYYKIDVYHYGWLQFALDAFEKELKKNKYDVIIPSFGPPIVLLAAKKIGSKYNIPVIADFRDIYINEKDKGATLFLKTMVQLFLLKDVKGLSFASPGMKDFFLKHAAKKLKAIPSEIIYNGTTVSIATDFDLEDTKTVEAFFLLKSKYDLLLLYPGTLYPGQNIAFFIDGLKKINEGKLKAGLVFLGLAENNVNIKMENNFIEYLPRVSFNTSKYIQKNAAALLWPVIDGSYTGFSGKIFEYMAAENIILISPNPQYDLNYFFNESKNIFVLNSQKDLEKKLKDIYERRITAVPLENIKIIDRKYWAGCFFNFINKIIINKRIKEPINE